MQLKVKNLRVSYGTIKALHGIDFNVEAGEILTVIGDNGAGKSTTLRAISRMIPTVQIKLSQNWAYPTYPKEEEFLETSR